MAVEGGRGAHAFGSSRDGASSHRGTALEQTAAGPVDCPDGYSVGNVSRGPEMLGSLVDCRSGGRRASNSRTAESASEDS